MTTVSPAQHREAKRRVAEAGLGDRITLLTRDYRDLRGRFDAIASIEMLEAVGHDYHPRFFDRCDRLLTPNGRLLVQTIAVADDHYDRARHAREFMKRHIFPGGCLPSVARIRAAIGGTRLRIEQIEDITEHYVPALREWAEALRRNAPQLRARGYDERLIRTFAWYFGSSEATFAERHTRDIQLAFTPSRKTNRNRRHR